MPEITKAPFGEVDGKPVWLYTLSSDAGVVVKVTNYGGIITAIETPDRAGRKANIVVGHNDLAAYKADNAYLGAIVGPYANRIANGEFTIANKSYSLEQNNGTNNLHSASAGVNKKYWEPQEAQYDDHVMLTLTLISPDGQGGFPGDVAINAEYRLNNAGVLTLDMYATSNHKTPISLTNHSYFNLAGVVDASSSVASASVLGHELYINADAYTPVNDALIPTGQLADVSGTPFDFRTTKQIGEHIDAAHEQLRLGAGYDHNFVLRSSQNNGQASAVLRDPESGRVLKLTTNTPGLQCYTANFLGEAMGFRSHAALVNRGAICLEPQAFPDTPNQAAFPAGWLLPGEAHHTHIEYEFFCE